MSSCPRPVSLGTDYWWCKTAASISPFLLRPCEDEAGMIYVWPLVDMARRLLTYPYRPMYTCTPTEIGKIVDLGLV